MKPMKPKSNSARHTALVNACLDLLTAHRLTAWPYDNRGWKTEDGRWLRKKRRLLGVADILCLLPPGPRLLACPHPRQTCRQANIGPVLAVECKTGTGAQTKDQKEFQEIMEKHGHVYLIVRDSIDGLMAWLKQRGIMR